MPKVESINDLYIHLIDDALSKIKEENQPKPFRRPYLAVQIQDTLSTKALYDTGADISCISKELFRSIPIDRRPAKLAKSEFGGFRDASGRVMNFLGVFPLKVQAGKKTMIQNFHVMDNLSEPAILGIDFIQKNELRYCPANRSFSWGKNPDWQQSHLRMAQRQVLAPLSVCAVKVDFRADNGCTPGSTSECLVNIQHPDDPLLTGGPYLVTPDSTGSATILLHNCRPTEVTLERGDFIGFAENVSECEKREINPAYIQSLKANVQEEPLTPEKKAFIEKTVKMEVPEELQEQYLQVILKNHQAVSQHKFDLGRTKTLLHEISLKTKEPIYVKQFRIPDAHREAVEKHVTEWLKMGVVQPTRSKYNSPIFAVLKKNGGIRLVQDFRALNAQTFEDKYSMKDINECIGEIGRAGSTIFTTIDLTAGFWQMLLEPKSRPYTAFTVPGQGQFQWVTSPMGLLGCPSSFQRLMEAVVKGIQDVIVYIDDLLLHSKNHGDHLILLDQVLQRLIQHGIKINLDKCVFGSKNVSYLGFQLTEEGIKPGIDKLKAVRDAQPPASVQEVRQFLGLCNFFRTHVRNFAQVSSALTALTRKDCLWKGGPLPPEALKAFRELQSILVSEPVVDYPRKDKPYGLITDASLGDDKKPGGLGAILTQINPDGSHSVIGYASRKLQTHEKNYTPYLLEMQGAIWGMEHFSTYLKGRHFSLFTDHKPLEKLGKVHTRTLNRLQEVMNEYDFEIFYKKGSEMPADFLSRNVVGAISWDNEEFQKAQDQDPVCKAIKAYLLNRELPKDPKCEALVRHFANDCFVENGILWRRIKRSHEPSRVVLFTPEIFKEDILKEAHGSLLGGHDGVMKTKERIFQCYYWHGMDKDIQDHLQSCHKCQLRKPAGNQIPTLLSALPQATEPNQRVHADLFGPLRTSGRGKKFILCITDSFTKYVELVAIENKEAETVSAAIFDKWICRYGVPLDLVTDRGQEFCAQLAEDLFKKIGCSHLKTTARHPQCNSQAEVANKTIAKYLASFVDESTLDWEDYVAPLMFAYNTSYHRSIKTSPFFLTYGMEPRTPTFPGPEIRRTFYGESATDELIQRLFQARDVARRINEESTEGYREQFNKKAQPHSYQVGQLVLLDEHSFLHKNTKLAPKWSGPHRILQLKGDCNVELKMTNGRKNIIHVNRLKPYFIPEKSDIEFVEKEKEIQKIIEKEIPENKPQTFPAFDRQDQIIQESYRDVLMNPGPTPPPPIRVQSSQPPPIRRQSTAPPITRQPSEMAPKRRGRPPKSETISKPPPLINFDSPAANTRSHAPLAGPSLEGGGNGNGNENGNGHVDAMGWILVTRNRRNFNPKFNQTTPRINQTAGWTKQQEINYRQTGDIYTTSDYINVSETVDYITVFQQPPVEQHQPVVEPQQQEVQPVEDPAPQPEPQPDQEPEPQPEPEPEPEPQPEPNLDFQPPDIEELLLEAQVEDESDEDEEAGFETPDASFAEPPTDPLTPPTPEPLASPPPPIRPARLVLPPPAAPPVPAARARGSASPPIPPRASTHQFGIAAAPQSGLPKAGAFAGAPGAREHREVLQEASRVLTAQQPTGGYWPSFRNPFGRNPDSSSTAHGTRSRSQVDDAVLHQYPATRRPRAPPPAQAEPHPPPAYRTRTRRLSEDEI